MATQDSSVPVANEKGERAVAPTNSRRTRTLRIHNIVWRFLTFASCLCGFVVMITNKQSVRNPITGGKLWAKYHYSNAFKWYVIATAIAFSYALLTMLFSPLARSPVLVRILLLLDLLVAFMLMSAVSAATAVAYIGKHGITEAQWSPICGTFDRYCDHIVGALIPGYLGWLFLFFAAIVVLHQLR